VVGMCMPLHHMHTRIGAAALGVPLGGYSGGTRRGTRGVLFGYSMGYGTGTQPVHCGYTEGTVRGTCGYSARRTVGEPEPRTLQRRRDVQQPHALRADLHGKVPKRVPLRVPLRKPLRVPLPSIPQSTPRIEYP
jgi:hypothetical protein